MQPTKDHFAALLPCLCRTDLTPTLIQRVNAAADEDGEQYVYGGWRVRCDKCGVGPFVGDPDPTDAVKRWNSELRARLAQEETVLERMARHPALQGDGAFDIGGAS